MGSSSMMPFSPDGALNAARPRLLVEAFAGDSEFACGGGVLVATGAQ